MGFGTFFMSALNIRSQDATREWGEKLVRQHRPADFLGLPDFMQPRAQIKVAAPMPILSPNTLVEAMLPAERGQATVQSPTTLKVTFNEPPVAKRLICAHCAAKISYPEGKFCWNNSKRFGGLAYCRDHQALMS